MICRGGSSPGDLLVVNTSGTLNAALPVDRPRTVTRSSSMCPRNYREVSGPSKCAGWKPGASQPYRESRAGSTLRLPAGGQATLLAPYPFADSLESPSRLWLAAVQLPCPVTQYLDCYGRPIRYHYVKPPTGPARCTKPCSPRIPAVRKCRPRAGRSRRSWSRAWSSLGVQVAPLLLHTGVASLESHEPPYEEFFHVPSSTAERVNAARQNGHRIVAVGTTVVRALETVTNERGTTSPGEGWTSLVVSPERPLRSVQGFDHRPARTAGDPSDDARSVVRPRASRSRLRGGTTNGIPLWHEFGDSHLILRA